MILVGRLLSPYVRRTAILLDLLDMQFENQALSAITDQQALRAINPLGRVPALIWEGQTLVDSVAIALALLDRFDPEARLWPPGGAALQEALQVLFIANGALDKFVASIYERTRRPAELVHGPWVAHCESQSRGGLDALEARLGDGFVFGDGPGYADIAIATMVSFIEGMDGTVFDAAVHPRMAALQARCEVLPVFANRRSG